VTAILVKNAKIMTTPNTICLAVNFVVAQAGFKDSEAILNLKIATRERK
jgi:hypothetical protein